jgi:V/A-type H+-transporting ATPase subunit A
VSPDWSTQRRRTRELLQQEERLREVAEIVGSEGLQDADRLVMNVAEAIRRDFLAQNAFTGDAFSRPADTYRRVKELLTNAPH